MKTLKISVVTIISFLYLGDHVAYADEKKRAEHSDFTLEQLAEHLGLTGGNWTVSFDEKLFCGFVITETSDDGTATKKHFWSVDASKSHQFRYMHHIAEPEDERENRRRGDLHKLSWWSLQEGEWQPSDESGVSKKEQSSGGSGLTYQVELPSFAGRTVYRNSSLGITPESPELLYSWSSTETERTFMLEVIFTRDTEKAEQE